MMLTLKELQTEAYATAREKGWHDRPLCKGTYLDRDTLDLSRAPIEPDHDRILAKHALIHSELTEVDDCLVEGDFALEYFEDKPEGFVVEAADVVIRVADLTAALGIPLDNTPFDWWTYVRTMRACIELMAEPNDSQVRVACVAWLSAVRNHVDQATEACRVDDWAEYARTLTCVVLILSSICAGLGLNLEAAITTKTAYNKTRPHRHGGKSA